MVERLFIAVPRGCLQFVIVVFPDHTHLLFSKILTIPIQRGSYMSAYVLLNLFKQVGEEIKCEACREFYHVFAKSYINSIIQDHKC